MYLFKQLVRKLVRKSSFFCCCVADHASPVCRCQIRDGPTCTPSSLGTICPAPKLNLNHRPLVIFLLGAPGTGKSTYSKYLVHTFGFTHISYGDLMRKLAKDPRSQVSKLPLKPGTNSPRVPSPLGAECLAEAIRAGSLEGHVAWLVDGFPRRNGNEEDNVHDWLKFMPPADMAILLSCPMKTSMDRIAGRAGQTGRLEDANAGTTWGRLCQAERDEHGLLRALRDTHSPILLVNTDRDVEIVQGELFSQVEVGCHTRDR